MNRFSVAAISAGLLLAATPALAATVAVELTADLAGLNQNSGSAVLGPEDFSAFSIDVAEGDVVDWTVRFHPGQSLALTDPTHIFSILFPAIGPFNYMTQSDPARLQLLGPNDEILADYTVDLGGVSSSFIIGLFSKTHPVYGSIFGGPVTFSGLRTVVTVGDYVGIPETVLTFNSARISFGDPSFVRPGGGVPEPATWALMILGFGAAGSMLRSRRIASAA